MRENYVRKTLCTDLASSLQPGDLISCTRGGTGGTPTITVYPVISISGIEVETSPGRFTRLENYDSPSSWFTWRKATEEDVRKSNEREAKTLQYSIGLDLKNMSLEKLRQIRAIMKS